MPIKVPGKRYGKRLENSKVFGHGGHAKKSTYADLLITPLVDMFVIIVLFLIANFSATGEVLMMSKDIQLPEASNVQEIEMVPVVIVSNEQVLLSGQMIARVEDLARDEYLNIPALEEKLRDMKQQNEALHAMAGDKGGGSKGDVIIQGSKELQFKIMKRVMFTCASAGYGNVNFAVMQVAGAGDSAAAAAVP